MATYKVVPFIGKIKSSQSAAEVSGQLQSLINAEAGQGVGTRPDSSREHRSQTRLSRRVVRREGGLHQVRPSDIQEAVAPSPKQGLLTRARCAGE